MIEIEMSLTKDTMSLKATGHAEYDEYGKDIVCAGVSSLVQTFVFMMCEASYKGQCELMHLIQLEGNVDLEVKRYIRELTFCYEMLAIGLESIVESHPDNVSLIKK